MAAPAAPEVAPAFDLTIGLWALASLLVLIGLKAIWTDTLGWVILQLADLLDFSILGRKVRIGGPLRSVENTVEAALGRAILENEKALGLFWQTNKLIASYLADSIAAFGQDVHGAIHGLVYGTIPSVAAEAVRPVADSVGNVSRVVRTQTTRIETRVVTVTRAQAASFEQAFGRAWRGIDHLQHVAIPNLWRAVHGIEADVRGLEHATGRIIPARLTRLEKALGATVIGGAAVAALTRVFPYWQCSNVKRFNRNVCRSPLGSLDWLFGLALATLVALDVEQIAHVGQDVTDELGGLWRQMSEQGS